MIDFEFNDKINEMINRIETRRIMFRTLYLTRGCGKEVFRKKLLDYVIKSIKENEEYQNKNKIDVKWVKYNDR